MLRSTQGEKLILRFPFVGLLGERVSVEKGGGLAWECELPYIANEGIEGEECRFCVDVACWC